MYTLLFMYICRITCEIQRCWAGKMKNTIRDPFCMDTGGYLVSPGTARGIGNETVRAETNVSRK